MNPEILARLTSSLGKDPDWFWEWVEINQKDRQVLPAWFRQATPAELLIFWKKYFVEILDAMIPNEDGFYTEEEDGGFYLSEDDMVDFNNWVIVQGKAVWEAVAKEAASRAADPAKYDDKRLEAIFAIYHDCRQALEEDRAPAHATWLGLNWQPRDGYFPGDTADLVYEERFGETLFEQL